MSQPTTAKIGTSNAYIALGSNCETEAGSPKKLLKLAINSISSANLSVCQKSRFFQTPAFPQGSGPDFVNAVIEVNNPPDPVSLLLILHRIEAELGRVREQRWGTRSIDLDLIDCAGQILPDPATFQIWCDLPLEQQMQRAPTDLILPHPRIQDRAFVLGPLCDIAPDWVHPVFGKSAALLFAECSDADRNALHPLPETEDETVSS